MTTLCTITAFGEYNILMIFVYSLYLIHKSNLFFRTDAHVDFYIGKTVPATLAVWWGKLLCVEYLCWQSRFTMLASPLCWPETWLRKSSVLITANCRILYTTRSCKGCFLSTTTVAKPSTGNWREERILQQYQMPPGNQGFEDSRWRSNGYRDVIILIEIIAVCSFNFYFFI